MVLVIPPSQFSLSANHPSNFFFSEMKKSFEAKEKYKRKYIIKEYNMYIKQARKLYVLKCSFSSLSKEKWLIFYSRKKKIVYEKGIYFMKASFAIVSNVCVCVAFYYSIMCSHLPPSHTPPPFPFFNNRIFQFSLLSTFNLLLPFFLLLLCSLHCRLSVLHSISY